MFMRSLFDQIKRGLNGEEACSKAGDEQDSHYANLATSEKLTTDVAEYFWSQIEMFGASLYRNVPIQSGGCKRIVDVVASLPHNLYVISCRHFEGSLRHNGMLYADWSATDSCGVELPCVSPILENAECIKALCDLLNISSKRVISCVVFSDKTRLLDGSIRMSRLRVEGYRELCTRGIWDVDGILLPNSELGAIDRALWAITWGNRADPIDTKELIPLQRDSNSVPACPKCGHPLKLATTTRGMCAMCTTYPLCSYTRRVPK